MKLLYVTNSEKRLKELKTALKHHIDMLTIDSLFDLEYKVELPVYSKDFEENAYKKAYSVWKKEKANYDYVIADEYGLFSVYAPNILGIEYNTWWPGTQRDKSEALVNLFDGIKEREIYYRSVFVAIDKKGDKKVSEGYLRGYLAKKVKERNGEGYDSVFIMDDGRYLSHRSPEDINKVSARISALEKLAQML